MTKDDSELNDPIAWTMGQRWWSDFCERHAYLGFSGNESSWRAFSRHHKDTLMEKGVMRKAGRNLIVDTRTVDAIAFECVAPAAIRERAA